MVSLQIVVVVVPVLTIGLEMTEFVLFLVFVLRDVLAVRGVAGVSRVVCVFLDKGLRV